MPPQEVPPYNAADFSQPPSVLLASPVTDQVVAKGVSVPVVYSVEPGTWIGDAAPSTIEKCVFYDHDDDKQGEADTTKPQDPTGPLTWKTSAQPGHQGGRNVWVRMYLTNQAGTKTCYVDSNLQKPIVTP